MPELPPKQRLFVEQYLLDMNATGAAERAGYAHPNTQGPRLLQKPKVAAAIAGAVRARSERTKIDADWVLQNLRAVYERVTQEVKPSLNSKTGKPLKDEDGNALYTYNASAALRALELIGKHVGVNAFEEKADAEFGRQLIERIQAGRRRVGKPPLAGRTIDVKPSEVSRETNSATLPKPTG